MQDLISRQDAIDALAKFVPYAICDESTESYTNGLTDAYNLICQLPSAQAEIIYCGECKHMMPNGKCRQFADSTIRPSASDFCSAGERKDNG